MSRSGQVTQYCSERREEEERYLEKCINFDKDTTIYESGRDEGTYIV